MKIDRDKLMRAVNYVRRVAGGTRPILNNVLFDFDSGALFVRCSNLDMQVDRVVEHKGKIKPFTVQAANLCKILDNLSTVEIQMELMQDKLRIINGKNVIDMPTLPAEQFPEMKIADAKSVVVDGAVIDAIDNVRHAAHRGEDRPQLRGINLRSDGKEIVISATDGHRLSVAKLPTKGSKFDMTIPSNAAEMITRNESKVLMLEVGNNSIQFSVPEMKITTRLLEDGYPADIERALFKGEDWSVYIDNAELVDAINIASSQSDAFKKETPIVFIIDTDGKIIIADSEPNCRIELSSICDIKPEKRIVCSFAAQYLFDGIMADGKYVYDNSRKQLRVISDDCTNYIMARAIVGGGGEKQHVEELLLRLEDLASG